MLALEEFVGPQGLTTETAALPLPGTRTDMLQEAGREDDSARGGRLVFFSSSGEAPEAVEAAATALGLLCETITDLSALRTSLVKLDPNIVLVDFEGAERPPEWTRDLPPSTRFRKVAGLIVGAPPRGALTDANLIAAGLDDLITLPQPTAAVQKR